MAGKGQWRGTGGIFLVRGPDAGGIFGSMEGIVVRGMGGAVPWAGAAVANTIARDWGRLDHLKVS